MHRPHCAMVLRRARCAAAARTLVVQYRSYTHGGGSAQPSLAAIVRHERAAQLHDALCALRSEVAVLPEREAARLAARIGLTAPEGSACLDALARGGALVRHDGLLHLRPGVIFHEAHHNLLGADQGFWHPAPDLWGKLQAVRAQLRPLEEAKAAADRDLARQQKVFWAIMLCYLGWQLWVFVTATFVWLDWDIMEPLTFFWMYGFTSVLGFFIFRRYRSDVWMAATPEGWDRLVLCRRAPRRYRGGLLFTRGFDASRYSVLKKQEQVLEAAAARRALH
eukprot:TRINITY_DN30152_c0_g1_i1.p1 TRINITY_DN30152_c0_g1~~TRINITY_DN30152_c0_g1_i1.p1  ORF type:complete len:302 (+),score=98.57 TRINITY_DN30152_c0_g1_i1:70-906(+)